MTKLFNAAEEQFIRSNIQGVGNQELVDMVNDKFGLSITRQQIANWKGQRKLSSGLTGRFIKGRIPVNKGTKGMFNVGGNKTSFKKGNQPANYKPVGAERIDRDGYIWIKVRDDGDKKWRPKHHVVWESANGPVPKKHVLIFLDGNKSNVNLDNLKLISNKQLLILNQNSWKFSDKDLIETGLLLADLTISAHKKRESVKNVKSRSKEISYSSGERQTR